MNDAEKMITAIEKAKRQSAENAQDVIIVPFREADIIISLLKDRGAVVRCKDCRYWVSGVKECHNINSSMFLKVCTRNYFCADGEV